MIEKVKTTYNIDGQEYRLSDPDHFYDYLARQDISVSIAVHLRAYRDQFRDKLEVELN